MQLNKLCQYFKEQPLLTHCHLTVPAAMSTQQVMEQGKKEIKATDDALKRSERIVEDTIQIATGTAATLHGQTKQLEKVLDDLDEITFSLKKAKQVIRDITRGLATDKYGTH